MAKKPSKKPQITGRELHRRVVKRLAVYSKLSLLESFAVFLGKAQVLEFGLKGLLARRYKYKLDDMERWTLGKAVYELEKLGLRSDFTELLKVVLGYRNYIAHEALVDVAMLSRVLKGEIGRLGVKHLERGAYEVERAILLYDWFEKHRAWGANTSHPVPAPTGQTKAKIADT